MSERRGGPIGLFFRRPGLCLATVGSVLTLSAVVNLAIVIFSGKGSTFYVARWLGWTWSSWIMVAGLVGFATGIGMLMTAAYLRVQPTKSRLIGSALIVFGVLQFAGGLYHQAWGEFLMGIFFVGIGAVLARRTAVNPPAPPLPTAR